LSSPAIWSGPSGSHQLSEIWVGKPWFVFINGEAAVTFFFVLSGYVLTLRPLRSGDPLATVRGVIKRWPRLAGPVLVATVLSCLLWNLGAYHHLEAAAITGSQWLATFATGFPSETAVSDMSLIAAIEQGTWRTFIYGDLYFDSVLWTMRLEFIGSIIAFTLAALLIFLQGRRSAQLFVLVLVCAAFAYRWYYLAFCFGVSLAWLRTQYKFEIPPSASLPSSVIAVFIQAFASAMLIACVEFCQPMRRTLDCRAGRLLGRYSFPIYLSHLLMLLSVGMLSFLVVYRLSGFLTAEIISVVAILISTFVAAHLLSLFEARWIDLVSRSADQLIIHVAGGIKAARLWLMVRFRSRPTKLPLASIHPKCGEGF
jgi:peptidoglycan/LPS O-acetylase OafA/YrhL